VAGGRLLVVPDGAAVLADPGEGPLDHPAARQDLEGMPVALSHDLHGDLHGRGPGGELASVAGIGPDHPNTPAGAVEIPQQRPGAIAVLDGRGGDHHGQNQARDAHGDVPLAAVDFLGVVPALACLRHSIGGAYGLGIDHRGRRLGVPPGGRPDQLAQRVVQPSQRAVVASGGEVSVDGLPGREVRGQGPPSGSPATLPAHGPHNAAPAYAAVVHRDSASASLLPG
jgi:hypothetical protein